MPIPAGADMPAADPHPGTKGNSAGNGGDQQPPQLPPFLSAEQFIAGYRPRRPLVKAWDLKKGWLYSFTAPTGGAKTAIALAEGLELARDGKRVVFMAGENPDDVRARATLMKAKLGLERLPDTLRFVDRTFNLHDGIEHVRHEIATGGGADLVIIDTSPAFQVASGCMEENNNPEAIRWAQKLREITRLQGEPAALALCHPIKRPQSIDDCLPRGGGGFIAEVDGNYASWCTSDQEDDKYFTFTWVGKFRGYFTPLTYYVQRATCEGLADPDGNPTVSVWASRSDDQHADRAAAEQTEDENAVLIAMADYPGKSLADWAKLLGWSRGEAADKQRVNRAVKNLAAHKLARLGRGRKWQLLEAGKKEAKRAAEQIRGEAV